MAWAARCPGLSACCCGPSRSWCRSDLLAAVHLDHRAAAAGVGQLRQRGAGRVARRGRVRDLQAGRVGLPEVGDARSGGRHLRSGPRSDGVRLHHRAADPVRDGMGGDVDGESRAAPVDPPDPAQITTRVEIHEGLGVRGALAAVAVGALGALGLSRLPATLRSCGPPVQRPRAHDEAEHDDRADDANPHPDGHRVGGRQCGGRLAGGRVARCGFGFRRSAATDRVRPACRPWCPGPSRSRSRAGARPAPTARSAARVPCSITTTSRRPSWSAAPTNVCPASSV